MPTLPLGPQTDTALQARQPAWLQWLREQLPGVLAPQRPSPNYAQMAREIFEPAGGLDPGGNPLASLANANPTATREAGRALDELDIFPLAGVDVTPKLAKGVLTAGRAALEGDDFMKVFEDINDIAKQVRRSTIRVSPETFEDDVAAIASAGYDVLTDPSKYPDVDALLRDAHRKMLDASKVIKERYGREVGTVAEGLDAADAEDVLAAEAFGQTEGEDAVRHAATRAEDVFAETPVAEGVKVRDYQPTALDPNRVVVNLEGEGGIDIPAAVGPRSKAFDVYSRIVAQKTPVRQAAREVAGKPGLKPYTRAKDAYYKKAKPTFDKIRESLHMGEALRPHEAIGAAGIGREELLSTLRTVAEGLPTVDFPPMFVAEKSPVLDFLLSARSAKQIAKSRGIEPTPSKLLSFSKNLEMFTSRIFEELRKTHPDKAQYLLRPKIVQGGAKYPTKGLLTPEKREALSSKMKEYWRTKKTTLEE